MSGGSNSNLSAEAQELIKLVGGPGHNYGQEKRPNIADLLGSRPELMKGLQEYLQWRDDASRAIAETKVTAPAGHEISKIALKFSQKKKGKKK